MANEGHESTQFSETVTNYLQYYVYRLIDPRNGETFYVGKGRGNRVFSHARGSDPSAFDEDAVGAKMQRIRDIHNARLEVLHVVHRHGLTETIALEVEAALIDASPGVANEQGGHGSGDRGPMHAQEIVHKYDLPTVDQAPEDRLVLINVNHIECVADAHQALNQVRFAWRISRERAEQADYVLAVRRGIVIGVFVADQWLEATEENFPELGKGSIEGRYGFHGHVASDEVWDRYVGQHGRRITNELMIPGQNPVRYWNI